MAILDGTARLAVSELGKRQDVSSARARDVLGFVGFSSDEMVRSLRQDVERALRTNGLSVREGRSLLEFYERGMGGYTYLE